MAVARGKLDEAEAHERAAPIIQALNRRSADTRTFRQLGLDDLCNGRAQRRFKLSFSDDGHYTLSCPTGAWWYAWVYSSRSGNWHFED